MQNRTAEARIQVETAAKLDPLSVIVTTRVGTFAWFEGRNADAEMQFRKALQLDSTFYMARAELPAVLLAAGKRNGRAQHCPRRMSCSSARRRVPGRRRAGGTG